MTGAKVGRGVLLLVLVGLVGAAGGFGLGYKWPIETLQELFTPYEPPSRFGWTILTQSDQPRYEMLKARVDDEVVLMGGFYTVDTEATSRVERLDLVTGEFTRLSDMPVTLTHAHPVVVRDTAWIVGGFVGDHPGPATDEVWRYSMADDTWEAGPPIPAPGGGGVMAALED